MGHILFTFLFSLPATVSLSGRHSVCLLWKEAWTDSWWGVWAHGPLLQFSLASAPLQGPKTKSEKTYFPAFLIVLYSALLLGLPHLVCSFPGQI